MMMLEQLTLGCSLHIVMREVAPVILILVPAVVVVVVERVRGKEEVLWIVDS